MQPVFVRQRLGRFLLLHPCLLLAGVLWMLLALFFPTDRPSAEIDRNRVCELSGWVRSSLHRGQEHLSFELHPERISQGGLRVHPPGRILVRFPVPEQGVPEIYYGERLELRTWLRDPSYHAVPGVPDWREHLWRRGVLLQADLKSIRQLDRVGGSAGCPLRRWLDRYRGQFVRYCEARLPGTVQPLILAAFLGDSGTLDSDTKNRVRHLGVLHLFVVSGLHVGLLWVALLRLLQPVGTSARWIALAGVWAYVGIVGFSTSAVRAGLMTGYATWIEGKGLRGSLLNHLGAAGVILLAVQPLTHASAGLQFSFLSLLGLGLASGPARRWQWGLKWGTRIWGDPPHPGRRTRRQRERRLRFLLESWLEPLRGPGCGAVVRLAGRLLGPLTGLILASLVVQVATLPLSLYYSNLWTWSQWWSNLVLIPLFSLLVPFAFLLLAGFWTPLAAPLAAPVEALARVIEWCLTAQERFAWVTCLRQPSCVEILIYYAALSLLLLSKPFRPWMLLAPPLLLYLFLVSWPSSGSPGLTVTMLDVGQGESLHISYPDGRHALVDTGGLAVSGRQWNDFIGERIVARYLWSQRIRKLLFVLLSHPHQDHIEGLAFLRRVFPIDALYYHEPHPLYAGPRSLQVAAGDRFTVAGVHHRVLHPPPEGAELGWGTNDLSLVLLVRYGHFSLLLTGDIEGRAERELAQPSEALTVLKVAHHGSRTSTSEVLLEQTRPRIALISAGRRNRFGHPAPATLARLHEGGSRVFSTSQLGSLRVETDGFCWSASHYSLATRSFEELFSECAPPGIP